MSKFINFTDFDGEQRVINTRYIVKIEINPGNYTTIYLEIPEQPSSRIQPIHVKESIDDFYDLIKD